MGDRGKNKRRDFSLIPQNPNSLSFFLLGSSLLLFGETLLFFTKIDILTLMPLLAGGKLFFPGLIKKPRRQNAQDLSLSKQEEE